MKIEKMNAAIDAVEGLKEGLLELEAMPLEAIKSLIYASDALSKGDLEMAVKGLVAAHQVLAATVSIFKEGIDAGMIPVGGSMTESLEQAVELYGGAEESADPDEFMDVMLDKKALN